MLSLDSAFQFCHIRQRRTVMRRVGSLLAGCKIGKQKMIMKRYVWLSVAGMLTNSVLAADSNSDAVKDAAKSLGEKSTYAWKTTVDFGGDRVGTIEGKTEKGGATHLSMSLGDNGMEAVLKADKGVLKLDEGWKLVSEIA